MSGLIVYLDSSSVVKRYVGEKGSEVVDRVYEGAEAGRLKAAFSVWNLGEVLGVLDRYQRRALLSEKDLENVIELLASESMKMIKLNALQLLPMTSGMLIASWLIVLKHHVYEADALQISSCKEAGCGLFLAADEDLVKAAKAEGLNALNIETQPEEALGLIA